MLCKGVWRVAVARLALRRGVFFAWLPDLAGDMGAVDVDHTGHGRLVNVKGDRLAQLVHEHKGGLVGDLELARHGQGTDALYVHGEDEDRPQDLLQRKLVVSECGPTGDRKDPRTAVLAAAPLLARSNPVVLVDAAAARAGLLAPIAPACAHEVVMHGRSRHPVDVLKGEIAGLW